jgi:hypothetical protein
VRSAFRIFTILAAICAGLVLVAWPGYVDLTLAGEQIANRTDLAFLPRSTRQVTLLRNVDVGTTWGCFVASGGRNNEAHFAQLPGSRIEVRTLPPARKFLWTVSWWPDEPSDGPVHVYVLNSVDTRVTTRVWLRHDGGCFYQSRAL